MFELLLTVSLFSFLHFPTASMIGSTSFNFSPRQRNCSGAKL